MLEKMNNLAAPGLHTAAHMAQLYNMKQIVNEPTKTFAARVQGIATICNLSKKCPAIDCSARVPFDEVTVLNITLSGLENKDMRDKCLARAFVKEFADVSELVQFCGTDEASRTQGNLNPECHWPPLTGPH